MKKKYVDDELVNKGKPKRDCIYVTKLMEKMKPDKVTAWVVDKKWLSDQLANWPADIETIRFAVDKHDELHIEAWYADAAEIEGCPPGIEDDPPGWNNDWPKVDLP
jgi:hypothetical protein